LKRKILHFVLCFPFVILFAWALGYFTYNHHQNTQWDKFVAMNQEKSKDFLEKLYFISNTDELEIVRGLIADNKLDGAVAIYLPFAKKDTQTRQAVEKAAKFVRNSYHLALLAYDHDESWDYELASELFGTSITQHCWPMGSVKLLRFGPRKHDEIRGCTSGLKTTEAEPKLRKSVRLDFESLGRFVRRKEHKR